VGKALVAHVRGLPVGGGTMGALSHGTATTLDQGVEAGDRGNGSGDAKQLAAAEFRHV
jgi:hypothetical protein